MSKRLFDIVVALIALLLLFPVLLLIALLVRLCIGSPIFFRQQRSGLHGHPFEIIKFRTMSDKRDKHGALLSDAERLTKLGRLLRPTSLDELPQLYNVIKGDMSLIGPRPLLMEYLPLYNNEQARRHNTRPGITGWAQINGHNTLSWDEKFVLDVWYVDHRSFSLDMKILWLTVAVVFKLKNISQPGHATMERFRGSKQ